MASSRRCLALSLRVSRPLFGGDLPQPATFLGTSSPGPLRTGVVFSLPKCNFHSSTTYLRVVKSPYPLMKFPEQPYFDFMFSKLDKHGHRVILVRYTQLVLSEGMAGKIVKILGARPVKVRVKDAIHNGGLVLALIKSTDSID